MLSVLRFFKNADLGGLPWLLVGKGPTFDRRGELPQTVVTWKSLGLNHVCLKMDVDVAHFTDFDAFQDCADHLQKQTCAVCLPWFPHVGNKPGPKCLDELVQGDPALHRLEAAGRLLSYNSTLAKHRARSLPLLHVRYFSAVAGLSILAAAGVKVVRTLGVDGGAKYAKAFDTATLLSNGRSSFDVQFREMRQIARAAKIELQPLIPMR